MTDWDSASTDEPLRSMLGFVIKAVYMCVCTDLQKENRSRDTLLLPVQYMIPQKGGCCLCKVNPTITIRGMRELAFWLEFITSIRILTAQVETWNMHRHLPPARAHVLVVGRARVLHVRFETVGCGDAE